MRRLAYEASDCGLLSPDLAAGIRRVKGVGSTRGGGRGGSGCEGSIRADALKIAKEFKELSAHTYVDFYDIASIYAGLGDKDEAFRLLEKGYAQRSATMPWLGIGPF